MKARAMMTLLWIISIGVVIISLSLAMVIGVIVAPIIIGTFIYFIWKLDLDKFKQGKINVR